MGDDDRWARAVAAGALSASLTHELRNALAVIETSVWLARRRAEDDALRGHLDKAMGEVRSAQALVERVLRLARGEPPARETVLAEALIDRAEGLAGDRPGLFSRSVPPEAALSVDPELLVRVLVNLYQNAMALREEGLHIETRLREEPAASRIEVIDNGPGFSGHAERLFEPLVSEARDGTGLGLFFARRVLRAHGGDIAAEQRPEGTVLSMWLPNAVAPDR